MGECGVGGNDHDMRCSNYCWYSGTTCGISRRGCGISDSGGGGGDSGGGGNSGDIRSLTDSGRISRRIASVVSCVKSIFTVCWTELTLCISASALESGKVGKRYVCVCVSVCVCLCVCVYVCRWDGGDRSSAGSSSMLEI